MGRNDTFLNAQMEQYRLQELIAIGGMARVYLGFDQKLERLAAVKVLELGQDWVDDTIVQRFAREAKSVAALEHDNIITIYQYGEYEGAYYIAMQYIDGYDLRKALKTYRQDEKRMPIDRALKIMRQVASAMDFAHAAGVIHRDIKPSNILLTSDDKAVLTDFGLVLRNNDNTMGTAFGTPRYIAPEQAIASQQAVAQSDIYSLAVIMYEILTGNTPFDGESPMEIALAHVSDTPEVPTLREPSLPHDIDDVIMQALSKEPEERYQTATLFVEAVALALDETKTSVPVATPQTTSTDAPPAKVKPEVKPKQATVVSHEPIPAAVSKELKADPERKLSPAIIGSIVAIILLGIFGIWFFNAGDNNTTVTDAGGNNVSTNADVLLQYNDISMLINNLGELPLEETARLTFVRGGLDADNLDKPRDDYSGDRFRNDILPVGECAFIAVQSQSRRWMPSDECSNIYSNEYLFDVERFFWRSEPDNYETFEIYWDGAEVQTCDTIQSGETGECRFTYPLIRE